MLQMGHNESSVEKYKSGLDYYYNATANAGAEFVLCSPIQRLSNSDSVNNLYTPAAKAYAESKNIPYVDLNCLTGNFNASLGEIKQWYTHVAYWQASADGASAFNDATHLNDYGADNTCRMAMEELKKLISGYVTDDMDAAIMPSDTIMKNGTNDYVMPPYKGNNAIFPYPENSDLEYEVEISDEAVNNGVLTAVKIKRNVQLSYITVFAAVYTKDGVLSDIMMKRLEPSAAGACETVELTDEERENGLSIPDGGKAAVFVWNGAFVDGSMDMKPLSEKYEIK